MTGYFEENYDEVNDELRSMMISFEQASVKLIAARRICIASGEDFDRSMLNEGGSL